MEHFIAFDATVDTSGGVKGGGDASEQIFRPEKGAMRDLVLTIQWGNSYSKECFWQVLCTGSIKTQDQFLVPRALRPWYSFSA